VGSTFGETNAHEKEQEKHEPEPEVVGIEQKVTATSWVSIPHSLPIYVSLVKHNRMLRMENWKLQLNLKNA
jgi:hypothetical protein